MFGRAGVGGTGAGAEGYGPFGGFQGFGDIFDAFFGGATRRRRHAARPAARRRGPALRPRADLRRGHPGHREGDQVHRARRAARPAPAAAPSRARRRRTCPPVRAAPARSAQVRSTMLGQMVNVTPCGRCRGHGPDRREALPDVPRRRPRGAQAHAARDASRPASTTATRSASRGEGEAGAARRRAGQPLRRHPRRAASRSSSATTPSSTIELPLSITQAALGRRGPHPHAGRRGADRGQARAPSPAPRSAGAARACRTCGGRARAATSTCSSTSRCPRASRHASASCSRSSPSSPGSSSRRTAGRPAGRPRDASGASEASATASRTPSAERPRGRGRRHVGGRHLAGAPVEADPEAVEAVSEILSRVAARRRLGRAALRDRAGGPRRASPIAGAPATVRAYLPAHRPARRRGRRRARPATRLGHLQAFGLRPIGELAVARRPRGGLGRRPGRSTSRSCGSAGASSSSRPGASTTRQPGDVVIALDPGMAFGTGLHPTTRLCLAGLERWADDGPACAAPRSSTSAPARASWPSPPACSAPARVRGVDTDPIAVEATRANAAPQRRRSWRPGRAALPVAGGPVRPRPRQPHRQPPRRRSPPSWRPPCARATALPAAAAGCWPRASSSTASRRSRRAFAAAGLRVVGRDQETDWVAARRRAARSVSLPPSLFPLLLTTPRHAGHLALPAGLPAALHDAHPRPRRRAGRRRRRRAASCGSLVWLEAPRHDHHRRRRGGHRHRHAHRPRRRLPRPALAARRAGHLRHVLLASPSSSSDPACAACSACAGRQRGGEGALADAGAPAALRQLPHGRRHRPHRLAHDEQAQRSEPADGAPATE